MIPASVIPLSLKKLQKDKYLRRFRFLVLSLILGVGACASSADKEISQPAETQMSASWQDRPADSEVLYQKRFAALAARERLEYDVMAPVLGAAQPNLPDVSADVLPPSAVEKIVGYAAANNSSALLVWHDGKLAAEQYFDGNSAATPMVSKSLSKPLSAIAIGRAIALGDIKNLNQKLSDFIVEWKGTPKESMTVRHMLSMTSGLLEQSFAMDPDSPFPRAYLDPYHGQYIIDEYPLTDTPGTKYSYNNATGDLVAIVIERATGRQYEEFIGTEILQKIGAPGGTIWLNRDGGLAHSGCCMLLPAESWLKLGILLVNDGKIDGAPLLPEGYVDQMRTASATNPYYGLGVWIGSPYEERRGFMGPASQAPKVLHSAAYLADDLFLFDGNGNQVTYIIPSKKLVILRMGDSPPKEPEWDNSFIPNIILEALDN